MRAAVVSTPGTIRIESLPDPTPGPGEIVVGPGAVGICGTDPHIIDGHSRRRPIRWSQVMNSPVRSSPSAAMSGM